MTTCTMLLFHCYCEVLLETGPVLYRLAALWDCFLATNFDPVSCTALKRFHSTIRDNDDPVSPAPQNSQ